MKGLIHLNNKKEKRMKKNKNRKWNEDLRSRVVYKEDYKKQ